MLVRWVFELIDQILIEFHNFQMEYHKVPVYLHSTITEIGDGYCVIKTPDESFRVECDAVINGIGFVPAPVGEKGAHVHRVGDCVAIGNLRTVIWRVWDVCMRI